MFDSISGAMLSAALWLGLAAGGSVPPEKSAVQDNADARRTQAAQSVFAEGDRSRLPFTAVQDYVYVQPMRQVRIQRRVIIRISPYQGRTVPAGLVSQQTRVQPRAPLRFVEKPHDECVAVDSIVGLKPERQRKLLLYMRDRRLLTLNLEKACPAAAFHSGLYVERSKDGKLCVNRDVVQSRSGAKCDIESFSQLVPQRQGQ